MNKIKITFLALTTLLLSFTTISDNVIDRIGIEGPIEFNKTDFKLSWSDHPNDIYYIQEYLPEGEKSDSFNQMMTIHLFNTDIEPKEAVSQKINELNMRKKTDAVCNYKITESPDGKEFIVDFLLGESQNNQMRIVEFNVYHYKQIEISKNNNAIVVYAFTKRSYGEAITSFLKGLGTERTNYLNQMISAKIPPITIDKK